MTRSGDWSGRGSAPPAPRPDTLLAVAQHDPQAALRLLAAGSGPRQSDPRAALRFAVSPIHELVNSLRTFRDRPAAAMHLPWLRQVSGRINGAALRAMIALVVPRGYTPDFLTPPPAKPIATIDEELDVLSATPADQVVHEIRNAHAQMHHDGRIVEPWLRDPSVALARAVDVLRQYWEDALAGVWPHVHGLLEADIAYRAGQLANGGLSATVSDLHETARWDGHHLVVDTLRTETCELAGRSTCRGPRPTWPSGPACRPRRYQSISLRSTMQASSAAVAPDGTCSRPEARGQSSC